MMPSLCSPTLPKQQTFDPINVSCPLTDQSLPFPVRATKTLLLNARDHDHRADMTLAAAPGDQRVKNTPDIYTVGLHPPPISSIYAVLKSWRGCS